jgi:hypothetical protein
VRRPWDDMLQLKVTANKLNKRNKIPQVFPDAASVVGTVLKGFAFTGTEVKDSAVNPATGIWYKDRDGYYYWGGGLSVIGSVPGPIIPPPVLPHGKVAMITTAQLVATYGAPSEDGEYLEKLQLPYPMRLSWDRNTVVNSIRCHKLVKDKLKAVFDEILSVYGIVSIKELGIDLYGGCFNYRKMRGGSDWSRHSWGVAIDLDPERNQLRETSATARFARQEYKNMIDIFYKHGFASLGREKNYDWMHFEILPAK